MSVGVSGKVINSALIHCSELYGGPTFACGWQTWGLAATPGSHRGRVAHPAPLQSQEIFRRVPHLAFLWPFRGEARNRPPLRPMRNDDLQALIQAGVVG